jgi:hypothetical protein
MPWPAIFGFQYLDGRSVAFTRSPERWEDRFHMIVVEDWFMAALLALPLGLAWWRNRKSCRQRGYDVVINEDRQHPG